MSSVGKGCSLVRAALDAIAEGRDGSAELATAAIEGAFAPVERVAQRHALALAAEHHRRRIETVATKLRRDAAGERS